MIPCSSCFAVSSLFPRDLHLEKTVQTTISSGFGQLIQSDNTGYWGSSMAWRQRIPKQPLRRTKNRCHHSDQSASAGARRKFRGVGRSILDVRLCRQRHKKEGGSLQCQCVWSYAENPSGEHDEQKADVTGLSLFLVIAGFFTGGSLAIRGGMKAARNSAIGCAILLAVIEGVGIGIQRMMAENTRLDVSACLFAR